LSSGSASEARSQKLRVNIRCALEDVRPKVERVRRFLLKAGCNEKEASECELALVEACTNAVQYVDGRAQENGIILETRLQRGRVEFRLTDHTPGFEWPDRSSLPDAESESGRGVFLIQSLMDSTEYVKQPGGNVLIMRKRLA
jgi:anti-sigma regulatory factor (Ser/Thr protein kinase)